MADPQSPAAENSPNKRKTTAVVGSPVNKRPNIDVEDTATSKLKVIVQEVELDDIEVYESILAYRSKKGVFPFENPTAMKNFLLPWLILHIGNEAGWKKKLERVKTKFTRASDRMEDGERKEFDLWMKIWGGEGGDDHDPTANRS